MNSTVQQQKVAQHPFLFQPGQRYSSSDDTDSPPSLTNSSESPRSASEEGGSSSPRLLPYGGTQKEQRKQQGGKRQLDPHPSATGRSGFVNDGRRDSFPLSVSDQAPICEDDDDESGPPAQALSPNWDSVFGAAEGSDVMDFAHEQRTSGPSAGHLKTESASSIGAHRSANGSSVHPTKWQSPDDLRMSDDAMFESLIQQESFEQSAEREEGSTMRTSQAPNSFSVDTATPSRVDSQRQTTAEVTPPQSAHPSTSALSSRRNSMENDSSVVQARLQQRIPHSGSHYSHTSDADLPSSSQVVVRPSVDELKGLQVHVHGISFSGAKSRVETQIRLRLELVRPVQQGESSVSETGFERIGAFNHVKLPPLTGTKRRSKKHKHIDVTAEKTLFMDAAVVRATPPHERVFVCRSCQQREKKRAQRRKTGSKKEDGPANEEEPQFTVEDYQELGIDPDAPDASAQAKIRSDEEDEKRVVVFNCGDFVSFEEGACILPTRITCYCRHHREKTGFCLIFTMRDYRGNLVATGSTPPIMITDDHKSVAAAAASSAAASAASMRRVDGSRSRAASSEAADEPLTRSTNGNTTETGRKARRAQRSKPYGDTDERSARRSNGLSMTPHTSTGQNTPAVVHSPPTQSDINHPEFWNAFAAMANVSGSPTASSRASTGVQTPHTEVTSPLNGSQPLTMPPPQQQASQQLHQPQQMANMNDWVTNIAGQGSISSQTLNLGPQSVPGFDLNTFVQSVQRGQREGDQASVQQLMMLARSLPGVSMEGEVNAGSSGSASHQLNTTPVPSISKLIPGEGPTSGGIEVTVLGENFVDGLTCYFGDVPATSTRVWGSNTLLCILPPSASPGPVAVTVKEYGQSDHAIMERFNSSLQLFTYIDTTDRALMELALQVVGLQMTGQMQSARDVAMRVVGSGPNQGMTRAHGAGGQGQNGHQHSASNLPHSRSAVAGLFATASNNQSFQDSVIAFLRTLDVDLGNDASRRWHRQAIRLSNKQGHTLLHLAVILGLQRLTTDLLQRGCPINARDHNGYTALHFASLYGRVTIARLLLSQGAQASVLCEAGRDALDVAREHEQADLENVLEDHLGLSSVVTVEYGDEESDGAADVDDDNLSSYVDESGEETYSSEGEQDEDERQLQDGDHPVLRTHISVAEESASRSAETEKTAKRPESDKGLLAEPDTVEERMAGLKGLVFGGLDFANRARLGMPNALHGGLPHFHVPVVSVFQMALPPSFTNWSMNSQADPSASTSNVTSNDTAKGRRDDRENRHRDAESISSTWRTILEESALWINPLSSPPPPAYDTLDAPANGASRFPAIASTSSQTDLRSQEALGDKDGQRSRSASFDVQVRPSTSTLSRAESGPSRSKTVKSSSTSAMLVSGTATASTGARSKLSSKSQQATRARHATIRSRSLKDDRMLVYFWLPILVSVMLLLCFAKPSSVLSFGDLMSFMPF